MTRLGRIRSEAAADWRSFLRRRTAVFFTFLFPVLLIVIFGALVQTDPTGDGLFAEPPAYYVPGYLAVVVLFTPLSRLGSEVARQRAGRRFEKLATTPLSRPEWLVAQTAVNAVVVSLAAAVILVLVVALTGADLVASPLVLPYVLVGVVCFCGLGAVIGATTDSRDGAVAASNAIGLPLLFLSETFVPLADLPGWFGPVVAASPLTYFARGVRAVTAPGIAGEPAALGLDPAVGNLVVLTAMAAAAFLLGARTLPIAD